MSTLSETLKSEWKHMKTLTQSLLLAILSLAIVQTAYTQTNDWTQDRKIGVVFGLTQPLVLNGFNIEGVYIHNRFIVAYSHGVSLDFDGDLLPQYLKDQDVVVHMPFTTGFGVGYRFTEWLNLRVEPKWHRFEFYYEGDTQTKDNRIAADAHNFSLGLGAYGFFQPFSNRSDFMNGITIAPSVRYWPNVASSFNGDVLQYESLRTGDTEELKVLESGIGFSPWIVNASIGYTF